MALAAALLASATAFKPAQAQAQAQEKAQQGVVKIIVPFPAGGVTDQAGRIVTEHMARQLGQTFVIENRPGAGGRLGIDAVMKSAGDGHTLLLTNSSYSILPVVDPKIGLDPVKALAPVSLLASYGLMVVASRAVPADSLGDFVAYARKNPGKLSYGSAGIGSGTHFAGEFFKSITGTFLVHIPYKSTTGALNDVAAGLVDLAFDASAKPLVDAGRVRLLAVTADRRDPRYPATPTAAQAGLKDFVLTSWIGILAPTSTPKPAIDRLGAAADAALADPDVRRRLAELGLQAEGGPASRLADDIRADGVLYKGIAERAKLQFE